MKRRFGDRRDGWLLKKGDPIYKIIPYIMKNRSDAQVFFEEKINIEKTEEFIRDLRKNEDMKIGLLHVIIASYVRMVSQKPKVNRFVSGRRIYARKEISVCLAVKKSMDEDTPETTIKVFFDPTDTIYDVARKINDEVDKAKVVNDENETDKLAKVIMYLPGFFIRFFVAFATFLDNRGWLPKFIYRASPFHTGLFVTDLGSLGINPVFHHIYNFGTVSYFLAFGKKRKERSISKEGTIEENKFLDLKVVVDERIVDGFYNAKVLKLLKRTLENPVVLTEKPEKVVVDNEI